MRTAGVASVGIILDMSGSVPLDELKQVMVAIADLPSPSISGIALTDVAVQHAGSREEILQLILSSKIFGGGTDFSKIADDAWKKIGCPPYLALISDGETVAWPARFRSSSCRTSSPSRNGQQEPPTVQSWPNGWFWLQTVSASPVMSLIRSFTPWKRMTFLSKCSSQ